ncbi:hypothetical protein DSO57_1022178 [Entomophthora muscae]|uniref:Uncharacterized protein n=1 Tax=Entomophthora muscae TaxID=34485 RepID=A0ACC2TQJ1_9FUNG|nr:hypothetical protein DSO57_1022178 [Entomophthora muscae]
MSLVFEPSLLQDTQNSPRQVIFPPYQSVQTSPSTVEAQEDALNKPSQSYTQFTDNEPEQPDFDYIAGTDFAPLVFSSQSNSPPNLSSTSSPRNIDFHHDDKQTITDKDDALGLNRKPRFEKRFGHIPKSPNNKLPARLSGNTAEFHSDLGNSPLEPPSTQNVVKKIASDFSQLEAGSEPVWERCAQSINSARALTRFLRRRAALEEEYAKNMLKMIKLTVKEIESEDVKQGTYGKAFRATLSAHEEVGKVHLRFSTQISSLADELARAAKEKEALRKMQRETGTRLKKNLADSETTLEKVRVRYLQANEGWDRALVHKLEQSQIEADQAALALPGSNINNNRPTNAIVDAFNNIFAQPKNSENLRKHEEEAKTRAASTKRLYHQHLSVTNHMRHDYFFQQLPDLISESLAAVEEVDQTTKSYLDMYVSRFQNACQETSGIVASRDPEKGLRAVVGTIDLHTDNLEFFTSQLAMTRAVSRDPIVVSYYTMSPVAKSVLNPKVVYGLDLQEQLTRDNSVLPAIVVKCVAFIDKHGLNQEGIYRRSGSNSKINRIRDLFNLDAETVDLETLDAANEVDNVSGALKLYLRELPTAVVPSEYWSYFLSAHQNDDPASQIDSLKSAVKKLPLAHARLLAFLMFHLGRVAEFEAENKMSPSNLSIVFGPTLFSPAQSANAVEIMGHQVGVTMTILKHIEELFSDYLSFVQSFTESSVPPQPLDGVPPSPTSSEH